MEVVILIVVLVILAGLIMVATDIIYRLAVYLVPLMAVVLIAVGIVVGLVVAVRNTFSVYRKIYSRKGGK